MQTQTTLSKTPRSTEAFARAGQLMPGGVSSPVRAYKSVGRDPIFVQSGSGAYVKDLDGNEYIDYVLSYGPLILGHCPSTVVTAITKAAGKGSSFGMPTTAESNLAEQVINALPAMERVRFVNSGTEATMSAIRLARGATGRANIIKCTGCYHGHSDGLLVEVGSGATTLGVPSSPGVPEAITQHTLLVPFNDLEAVRSMLKANPDTVAAVVVEPIAGNMGTIPPLPGYLQGLRDLCDEYGALLLFDEVMTGFRVAYGCAQSLYGIEPDLTCLGKVIGGGLPCAAYGGRAKWMNQVAPSGPVYQAGTLSGNPLAMAAGIAMLNELQDGSAYEQLEAMASRLATGLELAASEAGVAIQIGRVGSMLTCFFRDKPVTNYDDASDCDTNALARFFGSMLDQGIVLPPSQYETWFLSTAHDEACIDKTIAAAKVAMQQASNQ